MEARRLRRSLERFYLAEGTSNSVRLAMPKGRYVPEFQHALAVQSDSTSFPVRALAKVSRLPGSSILVMPFDAEGDRSIVVDYSDGFTRQLLVGLSRFPELCVFGPNAVVGDSSKPSREPPRDSPRADFVLSGSTAVFADVLNVKAMLADAATGEIIMGTDLRARSAAGEHSQRARQRSGLHRAHSGPAVRRDVCQQMRDGRRCEGRGSAGI